MEPSEFLAHLWGWEPPHGLLIQTWDLRTKRSSYFRSPAGTEIHTGHPDVFTGVSLAGRDHGARRRCPANEARAIPGLWLDVDVKPTGAPSRNAALRIARHYLEPTLIVDSGHGYHAWYLLTAPWCFRAEIERDHAMRMSAQWQALHQRVASAYGWRLDSTRDLARLLRLPGTYNGKDGLDLPVRVVRSDGPRYALNQLDDLCRQASDDTESWTSDTPDPLNDVYASANPTLPSEKFQALLNKDKRFRETWLHTCTDRRARTWSDSEYELSLAIQAIQHEWTNNELVALLVTHRKQRGGDHSDKWRRVKYVRDTIARARHSARRAEERKEAMRLSHALARGT